MDNQRNERAQKLAGAFAEALAESLTRAIGSPWQLKVLESPDLARRQGKSVHYRLKADGALRGDCFAEFYEPHVADLGSNILGRPRTAFSDEHSEALGKVITAAMAGLTASLSAEYGELTLKVDRVADLAFGGMFLVPLAASGGEQSGVPVLLYFDVQLLEALAAWPAVKDAADSQNPPIDPINLKLVMDVELNVSLRFGQRQLPLREVLELASGSVIELDRQVDDPVELLLDGKLIARGEAVIVDGNYGLRVTEIPHPITSHFLR